MLMWSANVDIDIVDMLAVVADESACVTTVYRPFLHVRYVCVRERVD